MRNSTSFQLSHSVGLQENRKNHYSQMTNIDVDNAVKGIDKEVTRIANFTSLFVKGLPTFAMIFQKVASFTQKSSLSGKSLTQENVDAQSVF